MKEQIDKEEETLYCDSCGKFPKHISVYSDDTYTKETLLCEKCFKRLIEEKTNALKESMPSANS